MLLSLPRNLQRVPFPEGSPLHELYPEGFSGPGNPNEWLLNAVYKNVPAMHPDVFADSSFPDRRNVTSDGRQTRCVRT